MWLTGNQSTFCGRLAKGNTVSQNWYNSAEGKDFPWCFVVVLPCWCSDWVLTSLLQGIMLQRVVYAMGWWGYVPAVRAQWIFVDDSVSWGKCHWLLSWASFQDLWLWDRGLSTGVGMVVEALGNKEFWGFCHYTSELATNLHNWLKYHCGTRAGVYTLVFGIVFLDLEPSHYQVESGPGVSSCRAQGFWSFFWSWYWHTCGQGHSLHYSRYKIPPSLVGEAESKSGDIWLVGE